jgi:hypothetical protein
VVPSDRELATDYGFIESIFDLFSLRPNAFSKTHHSTSRITAFIKQMVEGRFFILKL